ncbi:MAG: cell division protein ZapA [Pseudomonadota bacterium]
MSDEGVKLMILDREYQIACPEDEREGLQDAARFLDQKMRDMRSRSSNIGADKLAVITALNIAYEMLSLQPVQQSMDTIRERLTELTRSVDSVLAEE